MKLELTVKKPITVCTCDGQQYMIGVGCKFVLTEVTPSQVTLKVNDKHTLTISTSNEHLYSLTSENVELTSKRLDVGTKVVILNPDHIYYGKVIELTGAKMYLAHARLMYKQGLYSNSEIFKYSDIGIYDESTKYEGTIVFYDKDDTVEKVAGRTFEHNGAEYVVVTGNNVAKYTNLRSDVLWCYKDDTSDELVPLNSVYNYW